MIRRKKQSKKVVTNLNLRLIYAENCIWSQRYKLWNQYKVHKPRLPNDIDKSIRIAELPDNFPRSFNAFVGKHNIPIFQFLNEALEKFEEFKTLPEILTLHGPSGSGKSAITKVFLHNLADAQNLTTVQAAKWYLFIDAKLFLKDFNSLWNKITKFAEPPFERYLTAKFRLMVVDNFEVIPPSVQQNFKRIMEAFATTLKYMFVCPDPKQCMISFIHTRSTNTKTGVINEKDALQVLLTICHKQRIGYNREGIQAIFKLNPQRSLSNMLDLIQDVFIKEHYVSKESVMKVAKVSMELPVLKPQRAIEPLNRCPLCTLLPPCQHTTLAELDEMGTERRKELPRYKVGSMSCPEFVRYGYCSVFNKRGYCNLDHPKNVHLVVSAPPRCPQCTIPWPCNHCAYTKYRIQLQSCIQEIQARIGRLRAINVPEPPMSLIRHLENMPSWKEQLKGIGKKFLTNTQEYVLLLESYTEWVEKEYATGQEEFIKRERTLRESFGELYTTPILVDVATSMAAAAAAQHSAQIAHAVGIIAATNSNNNTDTVQSNS